MTTEDAIKAYDEAIAGYAADLIDNHHEPEVRRELERQHQLFVMGRDALKLTAYTPTNSDRIRDMSDQEMAVERITRSYTPSGRDDLPGQYYCSDGYATDYFGDAVGHEMRWLARPAQKKDGILWNIPTQTE